MPHVAVIAAPVPGHLNPLQVLGAELVARGFRVTIVHLAGAERFVTDPAIGFAPLPGIAADRLDAYLRRLARPTGPVGFARMIRATAEVSRLLLDRAPVVLDRIGADAIIADAVEPAGPLIAQHMGLPHVVSVTGLPLLREAGVPPPFLGWRYRADALGRFRNRGGYAVSDRLMRPITAQLDDYRRRWRLPPTPAARLYVAQCPRSLDYPRSELPAAFHYGSSWRAASSAPVVLPRDGRALVFCSLGTLQGSRRALFARMASACAGIGARAVIAHGGGLTEAEAATLPGDPLVRAFWPQQAVLDQCAAAVLHGGFNSVLDALAAGLPMLVLPIAFEQPATAARVVRLGAGAVLPRWASSARLARALDMVIRDPAYRRAAQAIAAEMAQAGGAAAAAAAISAALAPPI